MERRPARPAQTILSGLGLRDTQPRRLVIDALQRSKAPASPYDLQKQIAKRGAAVNAVTVYRVLAALEELGLVHKHPCDGRYMLCSIPDTKGHHGFLHCHDCGGVEEFHDERLCVLENAIAESAKFHPSSHVSEIVGTCRDCR